METDPNELTPVEEPETTEEVTEDESVTTENE